MNILIFGNSIAQGFTDSEYGGWANRLAIHVMKKGLGDIVFNIGISGEDVIGIANRFKSDIENRVGRRARDICILLAVGINDSQVNIKTGERRTEPDVYQSRLQEMVSYANESKKRLILVGLTPVDEDRTDPIPWHDTHAYRIAEVKRYNAIVEKAAKENNLSFIPMQDVFGESYKKLLPDGLHPNAEGHRLMFERVNNFLERENVI